MNRFHAWLLAALCTACAGAAQAAFTNVSSVLDGAGQRSADPSGTYSNLSAVAQPGGVAISSGGTFVNYAGFLNTFSLRPNLDTDGDGLANEVDADNDGDQLADMAEIEGSGFQPVTPTDLNAADTDEDDAPDGEESIAGTDPTNDQARLEIILVDKVGGDIAVEWVARQGKNYSIRSTSGSHTNRPAEVEGFSVGGVGSGPWQVTTNLFTDVGGAAGTAKSYTVEALRGP